MPIKELLPAVEENISLAEHSSFKIGGPAKYFFIAKTRDDIIRAVQAAQELKLPFFILGGGSNVLFPDNGFNGLVIKIKNQKATTAPPAAHQRKKTYTAKIKNTNQKSKIIIVEPGVNLSKLVELSLEKGLTGLEWAAGIPWATIGGAIRGNAGAFGSSMADIVKNVEVLDTASYEIKKFSQEECQFEYRQSIFKRNKNLIILSAEIQLPKGDKEEIKQEMAKILKYRQEHHPLDYPSAGSVFENIAFKELNKDFLEKFPEAKKFSLKGTVPAGFLIEKAGLKGKTIGRAQVSKKHANFIVNLGGATAKNVLDLIGLIKKEVKDKFGIELKEEIIIVNHN